MVGSVERIDQDIAALDKATAAIAEEFHNTYSGYLALLGQAVRQQLILASYHVCTQGYPEQFLRLSYSQRQQLQQMLRALAQQVQEELLAQLHVPVVPEDLEAENLPSELLPGSSEEPSETHSIVFSLPTPVKSAHPLSLTPVHLAQWREDLEQSIVAELHTASHAANRLLQQAGVLPKKLPEPVLEAATKAELSEIGSSNTPNLLHALVETASDSSEDQDTSEELKGHSVMHIVAIHLRLAEIEFTDASVGAARGKIRSLTAQLKTLRREYQKKQRERSIAEAQAAWRSSWSED